LFGKLLIDGNPIPTGHISTGRKLLAALRSHTEKYFASG
jgi:hypothetical protein